MARQGQTAHRRSDRVECDGSKGAQNLLCAYLAGAVLIGLLGNTLVGAWWLDPMVGLLIAGLAVYEGRSSNGVDFVRSRVYATVKCTKPPALW